MDGIGLVARFQAAYEASPTAALSSLDDYLGHPDAQADPEVRAGVLRHASLAARVAAKPERATELSRQAVDAASQSGSAARLAEAQMTHAYNLFLGGDTSAALEVITSIDAGDDKSLAGRVGYQHGLILARSGATEEAQNKFDQARHTALAEGDDVLLAMVERSAGMMAAQRDDHISATVHFSRALELYVAMGNAIDSAWVKLNLAIAAAKSDQLPEAFQLFNESSVELVNRTDSDFEFKRSYCDALMRAGMFSEAARIADEAAVQCIEAGMKADAAETLVIAAAAWLEVAQYELAVSRGRQSADAFRQQGRRGWDDVARLIQLRAQFDMGVVPELSELDSLLPRLDAAGMDQHQLEARLLKVRVLARQGDIKEAETELQRTNDTFAVDAVSQRLAIATASAEVMSAKGDAEGLLRTADSGFEAVLESQAAVGSPEIRTGIHRHARRLADLTVAASANTQSPLNLFEWFERIALVTTFPRPAQVPAQADLTSARTRLRSRGLSRADRQQLEDLIQSKTLASQRGHRAPTQASVDRLSEALGDRVGLVMGRVDDQLTVCRFEAGSVARVDLGPIDYVERRVRALRQAQRRWAQDASGVRPDRVLAELERLDQIIFEPLGVDGVDVVIVPPPDLFALPFASLPSRCPSKPNHSTTTATSLTAWVDGGDTAQVGPQRHRRLMASGPATETASLEVESLAIPDDIVLAGRDATAEKVLAALNEVDVAHLATHGIAQPESPMFSSLQFYDRSLDVYELQSLTTPPKLLVLSACDVGETGGADGNQTLGLVTALLNAGVGTVLAAAVPVPDTATLTDLMADFHVRHRRGDPPSTAWAAAVGESDKQRWTLASGFSLFGRG